MFARAEVSSSFGLGDVAVTLSRNAINLDRANSLPFCELGEGEEASSNRFADASCSGVSHCVATHIRALIGFDEYIVMPLQYSRHFWFV